MERIVFCTNPFDRHSNKQTFEGDYVGRHIDEIEIFRHLILEDIDYIYSVNGKIVEQDYQIQEGDELVIVAKITGGQKTRDIGRTVAMIAIAFAVFSNPLGGFLAPIFGAQMATFIGSTIIAIGGAMLVNWLLPPIMPKAFEGLEEGNTYGFEGSYNQWREGITLPVLYGTMKITPAIIERYTDTSLYLLDESKQSINMLFGIADHQIDSITDIKINDVAYTTYANVSVDISELGTNTDNYVDGFSIKRYQQDIEVEITGNDYAPSSGGVLVDNDATYEIEFIYKFPQGVYKINGQNIEYRQIRVQSEWSLNGTDWTSGGDVLVSKKTQKQLKISIGHTPSVAGKYYVRAKITTTRDDNYGDYCIFSHVIAKSRYGSKYPNVAKLGLRALATEQLNGSAPKVTCIATRSTVQVWNGSAYVNLPATNPAWVCYDILHNSRYGANIPYSRLIYADFLAWANFCTTNSYTCNMYVDTEQSMSKVMNDVSMLGRGTIIQRGTSFGCVFDGVATASQVFNISNVVEDSFTETFLSRQDRANVIRVTYWDSTDDYQEKVIELTNKYYDDSAEEEKARDLRLIGCTNSAMATKYAKYLLNCNDYIIRTVKFSAFTDALSAEIGDVIRLQHDVPLWAHGGRVVSATNNTVTIDKAITFPLTPSLPSYDPNQTYYAGAMVQYNGDYYTCILTSYGNLPTNATYWSNSIAYVFQYRDNDTDTLYSESITSPTGSVTSFTKASGNWTVNPAKDDLYIVGVTNSVGKLFRIANVTISSDHVVEITATEYRAEVYTDNASIPDYPDESYLNPVSVVRADDVFIIGNDGQVRDIKIAVSWSGEAVGWYVFYKDADSEYKKVGYFQDNQCDIYDVEVGKTYTVSVSVNDNPYEGFTDTVTIAIDPPEAVINLTSDVFFNNVLLKWDVPSSDLPIDYYQVLRGTTFATATPIGQVANKNFINFVEPFSGDYTYWVYAVDTAGNKGNEASVGASITSNSDYQVLDSYDTSFGGTITNFVKENGDLFGVITAETWQEHFENNNFDTMQEFIDAGYTFYYEPYSSTRTGSYIEPTIDLGSEADYLTIRLTVDYDVIEGSPNDVSVYVDYIKTSADDITYDTQVGQFEVNAENVRYIQYKFTVTCKNDTFVRINNSNISLVGKEMTETGNSNVTDAGTGKNIVLAKDFFRIDSVQITPVSTSTAIGGRYEINQPTDITVKLYDAGGTSVTGGFSYLVTGV